MMAAAVVGRNTALEKEIQSQKQTCDSVGTALSKAQRELVTARSENVIINQDFEEEKKKNAAAARLLKCDGTSDVLTCSCHYHTSRALRIARAGEAAALEMVDDLNIKNLSSESALNDIKCEVVRSLSSGSETLVSPPVSAGEGEEGEEGDDVSEASSEESLEILGCDPGPSSSPPSSTPEAAGRVSGGFAARSLGAHMPGLLRR